MTQVSANQIKYLVLCFFLPEKNTPCCKKCCRGSTWETSKTPSQAATTYHTLVAILQPNNTWLMVSSVSKHKGHEAINAGSIIPQQINMSLVANLPWINLHPKMWIFEGTSHPQKRLIAFLKSTSTSLKYIVQLQQDTVVGFHHEPFNCTWCLTPPTLHSHHRPKPCNCSFQVTNHDLLLIIEVLIPIPQPDSVIPLPNPQLATMALWWEDILYNSGKRAMREGKPI